MWHAPFYRATAAALKAGNKAGYAYAESVIDNMQDGAAARRNPNAFSASLNAADFIENCLSALTENGGGSACMKISICS